MENENREWKEVRLGEIAKFSYGKMPKKEFLNTGKYPTYSGYKYQYTYPEYNCDKGDIILVARGVGGTGDVKIVKEKCYLTNLSIKIELEQNEVNNEYFYYMFLLSNLKYLDSGSAQSQITIGDLERLNINLPPLPEQKRIAEILSSLDDKIELNNQMNKTLEEMAQAIFKQWFVDFEFPNENGEPYKSSGGEMEESEMGMIPKGWRVEELKEIFIFVKGKKPKDIFEKKDENMESYLTIDVLSNNGKLFALPEKTILANKFSNLMVMDGASSGAVFYGKNGIVASTLARLDVIDTCFSDDILYTILKHYENDIKQHTTGSAIPHTDKEYIYKIKVPTPNENILKDFSNIIKNIRSTIINNNEEANILIETRDTLLPKLMSGEIDFHNSPPAPLFI